MNSLQIGQPSETKICPMSEAEAANWCAEQGISVVCHRGRYWKETKFGFYEPIHLLARLTAEQATCPKLLNLGFRASLCDDTAAVANGTIPVHLLSNLESYNFQSLSSKRRNHLRRCYKRAKIVQLSNPALLQEQGYKVYYSAETRFGNSNVISKSVYLSQLEKDLSFKQRYIFAGLINDKLGGYMITYVIEETAYVEQVLIATEALPSNIGTGLIFEFAQACRNSGSIREIVYGYDTPKDPALGVFKEGMGFPVKHIPSRIMLNPLIEPILRWRYRSAYYFITGKYIPSKN